MSFRFDAVARRERRRFMLNSLGVVFLLSVLCRSALATPVNVSIDTSEISGQWGALVFDLLGDSPANSLTTIGNFTGNALFGDPLFTIDAAGSVAAGFSLGDGQFFNEIALPAEFGSSLGFSLDFAFGTPDTFDFPDELSVFLLTPDLLSSLVSTTDPTGGDSILTYFVDPSGLANLSVYAATAPDGKEVAVTAGTAPVAVPEPSSLALMMVAVIGILWRSCWSARPDGESGASALGRE